LDLDVLELGELSNFQRIYDGPADGVEDLCGEVGCLPLALDQAAAYCEKRGLPPDAISTSWPFIRPDVRCHGGGGDAQRTVARVWQVTLERLDGTPAVARILRTLAWWAPRQFQGVLDDWPIR